MIHESVLHFVVCLMLHVSFSLVSVGPTLYLLVGAVCVIFSVAELVKHPLVSQWKKKE